MSRPLLNRVWYQFWRHVLQLVAVLVYRVRYSGRENIPAAGGVLVVSNHQSHFDPPLVGIGCPRQMNYVARETLFGFRLFGWILKSVGGVPIDRDGFGLRGIKESLKLLKRGEMVLIFPEGTRSRTARSGGSVPASPPWPPDRMPPSCRWPSRGRFGSGRARKDFPASARFASITANRSRTPKSPAATNARCSPRSNAASTSVSITSAGKRNRHLLAIAAKDTDSSHHGGADIPVCREECGTYGRRECLPHRHEIIGEGFTHHAVFRDFGLSHFRDEITSP